MKYVKQMLIILMFSFMGELLHLFISLPIPGSIYGMVLLFLALLFGIIKLDGVKETAKFLVEIMPVMFIPAGVGLMVSWDVLRPMLIPVAIITVITNITVMAVTGRVAQGIIRKDSKQEEVK